MSETEYVAWWSQEDAYELDGKILAETRHTSVVGEAGQFIIFDTAADAEYAESHGIIVFEGEPDDKNQPASAHKAWK